VTNFYKYTYFMLYEISKLKLSNNMINKNSIMMQTIKIIFKTISISVDLEIYAFDIFNLAIFVF